MSGEDTKEWLGLQPTTTIRQPQPTAERTAQPSREYHEYEPWGSTHGGNVNGFRLHPKDGFGRLVPYHYVTSTSFIEEPDGQVCSLTLLCADCTVKIEGRGLFDLLTRLQAGEIAFIREFNAARWPQPPASAPVVTTLRIDGPTLGGN